MRCSLRTLIVGVALSAAMAAEPDLTVQVNLAALRADTATVGPAAAWVGTDAWTTLQARLDQAATAGWPPVREVLDQAQRLDLARTSSAWAVAAPSAGPRWQAWAAQRPVASLPESPAPLAWRWDATATLAQCARAGWELPFHAWRGADAVLVGAATIDGGAWRATTRLTSPARAAFLPIGPLAEDPEALVSIAAGIEPEVLVQVLVRNLRPGHRRFLEERLGRPLADVATIANGQVRLRVAPGALVPVATLAIGLRPEAPGDALVIALGDSFRGQPTSLAGSRRAARLETPVGPWVAAWTDGWLVLGNDPQAVTAALAAPVPTATGTTVVEARADVPALVRRTLPWALAAWGGLPLVEDPLPRLAPLLEAIITAQFQAGAPLEAALAPEADIRQRTGQVERTWRLAEADRVLLTTLLGPVPEERVAVYAAVDNDDRQEVVLRAEEGWLVLADVRRGFTTPVTAEAATRRLRDLGTPRLRSGRPLATLEIATLPPAPRVDRACVPDPEHLAQHLRPWHLTVRQMEDGMTTEERGLPLANLLLLGMALAAPAIPVPAPGAAGPLTEL